MKLNKIVLLLTLALVATLATTGCRKTPPRTTQLPGNQPMVGGEPQPPTLPNNGNPFGNDQGQNPTSMENKPGSLATSDQWDPSQCDQDRAALADQTVHFAYDSAAVLTKEQNKIVIVSEKLKSDPAALLLIEGNCDERGTEEYNRSLGERRALALREALANAGIDPQRIRTISYGKDKPADPGHDDAAWKANRRDDFVLLHPKTGA